MRSCVSLFVFAFLVSLCCAEVLLPLRRRDRTRYLEEERKLREVGIPLANKRDLWLAEVLVGTPPQPFLVHIDLASNDLLLYGTTCRLEQCPGLKFDRSLSSTYSVPPCHTPGLKCASLCISPDEACLFNRTYTDKSWAAGIVSSEVISLHGMNVSVNAYFGLVDSAHGAFDNTAFYSDYAISGIFGLLPSNITSAFGAISPIWSLLQKNSMYPGFTLCMEDHGGYLILDEHYEGPGANISYNWTDDALSGELFAIQLEGLGVTTSPPNGGNAGLNFTARPAILDTATTGIDFGRRDEAKIKAAFQKYCPGLPGVCGDGPSIWNEFIRLTDDDVRAFPSLVFRVKDIDFPLVVTPYDYLYRSTATGRYIMNIHFVDSLVLGTSFVKNYRIAFDHKNNRIGFAKSSTCPKAPPEPVPGTTTTGGSTNNGGDGNGGGVPGKTFWIILGVVTGSIILLIIVAAFIYVRVKRNRTKQYTRMQDSSFD